MKRFRFKFTLWITKLIIRFMKLLGFNATNIPGEIALKLYPDILKMITPPKCVIATTGTNGKTSTNNMLSQTLRNCGYTVFDNGFGSNIISGIVSCLITNCDLNGVCHQEFACLEIDERSSIRVYKYLHPNYLLCTNLQRDSMMRNANVQFIFNIIDENLPQSTKLVLNGDDLISSQLGKGRNKNRIFFKVLLQKNEICRDNLIKDIVVCPQCGNKIEWDFVRNHSLGQGHCPNCDFASPECKYILKEVKDGNIIVSSNGSDYSYPLVGYRTVDYYNETAVISLLSEVGLKPQEIARGLKNVHIPTSRFTAEKVNGIEILSILSKGMNSVAISSSCDVINKDPRPKAVILNLDDSHDAKKSSEMISYIYDVDFEFFKDAGIKQIMIGGKRSQDYLVRMLYAGIDENIISTSFDPAHSADKLQVDGLEVIYILFDMYDIPNYKKIKEKVIELCRGKK
ncbi:MAG: MurT ligase domain-containing protein [Erysipelotrichia bacterium]|nr:MurT ligase domain-containing protein [Erysipelotrichia bacterium]